MLLRLSGGANRSHQRAERGRTRGAARGPVPQEGPVVRGEHDPRADRRGFPLSAAKRVAGAARQLREDVQAHQRAQGQVQHECKQVENHIDGTTGASKAERL